MIRLLEAKNIYRYTIFSFFRVIDNNHVVYYLLKYNGVYKYSTQYLVAVD